MNITHIKDAGRVLRNMVMGIDGISQVKKGDQIVYWRGNYSDNVGQKEVGRAAMALQQSGMVHLKQRIVGEEITEAGPIRTFEYVAEVK